MKKHVLFFALFCATLIMFTGANASLEKALELVPGEASMGILQERTLASSHAFIRAEVQKLDSRCIAPLRDVVLYESAYAPNDWDGEDPFPPVPWSGDIGTLPTMETTILNGTLDSTGFSEDWWAGDTDLFGFSLPDDGILNITVEFSPGCSDENIYNVLFLGATDVDTLYILDANSSYPDISPVDCPVEVNDAIPAYVELVEGEHLINEFYLLLGGANGMPPSYTITWFFTPCGDGDGDEYLALACGGNDCDDRNPSIHPRANEIPGDGIDQDCSGSDRRLDAGEISEEEPNDTPEAAQDLGTLEIGGCFEIEGNFGLDKLSPGGSGDRPPLGEGEPVAIFDTDEYVLQTIGDAKVTLNLTFDGVTEEIGCWLLEGDETVVFITSCDLVRDGQCVTGDYHLSMCAETVIDADGDGWFGEESCGDDCDDTDPDVNPGAHEGPYGSPTCSDGIDNDCDGRVDSSDPDLGCGDSFTLELDASYTSGILNLVYTIGTPIPSTWSNFLILTDPTFYIVPLWEIPLPVIDPPMDITISIPLPSLGIVWILSVQGSETLPLEEYVLEWVDTGK